MPLNSVLLDGDEDKIDSVILCNVACVAIPAQAGPAHVRLQVLIATLPRLRCAVHHLLLPLEKILEHRG